MRFTALFFALAAGLGRTQTPAVPAPSRMEIVVHQKYHGIVREMDPRHVFERGDLVRFWFKPNFSGFLYVMNQSTSGKYILLFPKDETGLQNQIEHDAEYLLPASEGWFRIDGPPGQEIVYWVVSPVELKQPSVPAAAPEPAPLPPAPAPKSGPLPFGATPRCDDTIWRVRGDCVDSSAGVKRVAKNEPVPENLTRFSAASPRELVFVQNQNLSMVSSPGPLSGPVIYEFRLAHK